MDYFLGAVSTILIILFFAKTGKDDDYLIKRTTVRYSQSHIFELVSPFLKDVKVVKKQKNTQSKKYYEKTNLKVVFIENNAYWIKDNVFYVANLENGMIDSESVRTVDTIGMDSVELDKMLFIMDRLREGLDSDSGSTGN
jgi:hypothetical protein